ncbi:hypothetical protein G7Y89_g781 [Cudoniella acicularis]|uniref:TEA domain-containing protein n=1 Tax=Cudoniella acicularis TaxID=354080 RepID=A0A8H4WAW1_9HELO|nr:hypothetical protein G7Y89_g781 [Cudoniella acicularis]
MESSAKPPRSGKKHPLLAPYSNPALNNRHLGYIPQIESIRDTGHWASCDHLICRCPSWPDHMEDAFWKAHEMLDEQGLLCRAPQRDPDTPFSKEQRISAIIKQETGELKSRMQVSTHIQIWRHMLWGEIKSKTFHPGDLYKVMMLGKRKAISDMKMEGLGLDEVELQNVRVRVQRELARVKNHAEKRRLEDEIWRNAILGISEKEAVGWAKQLENLALSFLVGLCCLTEE